MDVDTYEQGYRKKNRFSFGKNWKEFLAKLDEEKRSEAKKSLHDFLGDIRGKTFIDVGCGSGLFSLAAYELGAQVTSVDVDDWSLACAKQLKKKFKATDWTIKKASALDPALPLLGTFDIVYSWGVLHHTGKMWAAVDNVAKLVAQGGVFYLALYNDNTAYPLEGTSAFWARMKKRYNAMGTPLKKLTYALYTIYLFIGITVHGINPYRHVKNYKTNRGMNFFTDVKDWLGGYPYEYATVREVTTHMKRLGLATTRIKKARSLGCNEFLLKT
ncbi:MAG TPA: class I SAM-dependent methyltransferase [Candidatus Nanoarchaeia archaeon]|nr:class I SAM-dependent methyltransferase [Candidatus Nanoarchaeia archaeon]